MKRFLLIVIMAAMIAWAIWFGLRGLQRSSSTVVAAFLPRETVFFAHLPDFNGARTQWHETDLYKLAHEPAVQEFLRKPLSNIPKRNQTAKKMQQVEKLEVKDAFLAVTSIVNNEVKAAGGFHFKGNSQDVENLLGNARAKLLATLPHAKKETIQYQQRNIETYTQGAHTLATVYDGNWFLAANDLNGIKTLMDRIDGRLKNGDKTLAADGAFHSASAHMPANYAIFFYLQPKPLAEKLASLRAAAGGSTSPDQTTMIERMKSVGGAFGFDGGKMHDVVFVGMPKFAENHSLNRSSLTLGTKDTFFYADQLLHTGQLPDMTDVATLNAFPVALQKIFGSLASAGVTKEDWKSAFDPELTVLGDWIAQARWPSILATLPVKDSAKAKKIILALTVGTTDAANWTQREKDDALYLSMQAAGGLVPVAPTIAISDRLVVAGIDSSAVEAAIKRSSSSSSELATSQTFTAAAHVVPAPDQAFRYIDTALLYTRLDATLRPMLLMGAMFYPKIAQYVDLSKLPAPDVIAKHLGPVVSSQYYKEDGYVTESVGPVTFVQAALGVGSIIGASAFLYHHQGQWSPTGIILSPRTAPSPTPYISPPNRAPTPAETP